MSLSVKLFDLAPEKFSDPKKLEAALIEAISSSIDKLTKYDESTFDSYWKILRDYQNGDTTFQGFKRQLMILNPQSERTPLD